MIVRSGDKKISVNTRQDRDGNTQYRVIVPDVEIEEGEFIKIKLPSGALLMLTTGFGESLHIYPDPEHNPVLSYTITEWERK